MEMKFALDPMVAVCINWWQLFPNIEWKIHSNPSFETGATAVIDAFLRQTKSPEKIPLVAAAKLVTFNVSHCLRFRIKQEITYIYILGILYCDVTFNCWNICTQSLCIVSLICYTIVYAVGTNILSSLKSWQSNVAMYFMVG